MVSPSYQTPLARRHRRFFFLGLLAVFLVIVPLLAFYANGYRYDPWAEEPGVTITGGFYIASQEDDATIYVNDEPVENTRFFRQATYIQNVIPGRHQVHVQGPGLQTWIKVLPVYPQIVTEAAAFTIPERPQIRPITPYRTTDNEPVFLGYTASSSLPFSFASSTVSVTYSASRATTTWEPSAEYAFLEDAFANLTRPQYYATSSPRFRFATATPDVGTTTVATSTKTARDLRLVRRDDEVFAVYTGDIQNIPYYFCVPTASATSTAANFGEHVAEALYATGTPTTTTLHERGTWLGQICRIEIRLDRKGDTVTWFDFMPGNADQVLLQLSDGLYVTEIDDRSWQNHQLLYPGTDITALIDGGQLYVQQGEYFAEVLFTLPSS